MKLRTSLRVMLLAPLALPVATLLAPTPHTFAAPAAPSQSTPRFALPTGRVMYKMTSTGGAPNGGNGNITMTWANHGTQFRQDIQMSVGRAGSRVPPINTWMIFDGHTAYVAMPPMMAGMGKIALKVSPNSAQLKQLSGGGNIVGIGASGKVVGKGTVLGKPCEIRQATSSTPRGTSQIKSWVWQGLPLRTEIQSKSSAGAATSITMVATQVNTSIKPAASLFKVPAGYTVQDMSALLKQMGGMMGKSR